MFSAQSLLAGNGTSVTCLRESREPITALNVATYVTPLVVRNFGMSNFVRTDINLVFHPCLKPFLLSVAWFGGYSRSDNFSCLQWRELLGVLIVILGLFGILLEKFILHIFLDLWF